MTREEKLQDRDSTKGKALELLTNLSDDYMTERFDQTLPKHDRNVALIKVGRLDSIILALQQL